MMKDSAVESSKKAKRVKKLHKSCCYGVGGSCVGEKSEISDRAEDEFM